MDKELENPIIIEFPLRGEWDAVNTPAKRIPSHGVDLWGQRYAYDFLKMRNKKFFDGSNFQYYLTGIKTEKCYCWNEPIYAPMDGEVVVAVDGRKEPKRIHPLVDLLRVLRNSISFIIKVQKTGMEHADYNNFVGNYIIIKHDGYYSFYAHIRPGTIAVKTGQLVKQGDILGKVGHTGNSTAPHLHFQLSDSSDLNQAKGIPCAFRNLEYHINGEWKLEEVSIPRHDVKFRYVKD
jgi:hypothetical protein